MTVSQSDYLMQIFLEIPKLNGRQCRFWSVILYGRQGKSLFSKARIYKCNMLYSLPPFTGIFMKLFHSRRPAKMSYILGRNGSMVVFLVVGRMQRSYLSNMPHWVMAHSWWERVIHLLETFLSHLGKWFIVEFGPFRMHIFNRTEEKSRTL